MHCMVFLLHANCELRILRNQSKARHNLKLSYYPKDPFCYNAHTIQKAAPLLPHS